MPLLAARAQPSLCSAPRTSRRQPPGERTLMTAFFAASAALHSRVQEACTPSRPARPACSAGMAVGQASRMVSRAAVLRRAARNPGLGLCALSSISLLDAQRGRPPSEWQEGSRQGLPAGSGPLAGRARPKRGRPESTSWRCARHDRTAGGGPAAGHQGAAEAGASLRSRGRPACLLVVGLQGGGGAVMIHMPHIALVDACGGGKHAVDKSGGRCRRSQGE